MHARQAHSIGVASTAHVLSPIHPFALRGFRLIARRRLRTAFRAVRLACMDRMREAGLHQPGTPVVVYLNHPSWWDPLMGFVLCQAMFGARPFYAPIDAAALTRYRILAHVGLFPVELDSTRGAVQFLHTADAVLDAGFLLGITPQGHFTDVRERPILLRGGLPALIARRAAQGKSTVALPLALEYTFWDQRLPEALALCGRPVRIEPENPSPPKELQSCLARALEAAQDELLALSQGRDPSAFTTVAEGRQGSAGVYGLWEDLRSLFGRHGQTGDHRASFRSPK